MPIQIRPPLNKWCDQGCTTSFAGLVTVCSNTVLLLLLCLLQLPLYVKFGPCFVMYSCFYASSSWYQRLVCILRFVKHFLLYFNCVLAVLWLSVFWISTSQWCGLVCSVWLLYFLVVLLVCLWSVIVVLPGHTFLAVCLCCLVHICVLCLFFMLSLVGMWSVIVAFPYYTLFFSSYGSNIGK